MVDRIEGGMEPIPPDIRETYKHEFARSVDLFQKSLDEFEKTDKYFKKEKFKDVMEKALYIMNEIASACLDEHEKRLKEKMENDYNKLIAEDNPENYKQLSKDIDDLKDVL